MESVNRPDYRVEKLRLETYANWPLSYMKPEDLAAAGFYYTGMDDRVRCFECGVEICRWLRGDNPMADHQRWQDRCRFVRKVACGNVPLGVDPALIPKESTRSRDVCGPYEIQYRRGATADRCSPVACIGRPKPPKHSRFASYDARVESFATWPSANPQIQEFLADAGFFYIGKDDQTLCYHCGVGLKDWTANDDPWELHAIWFPKCLYLLAVKGQNYVNLVTGQCAERSLQKV